VATQRKTEGVQQESEELTSQGTERAPEMQDDYYTSETSADQGADIQPQVKGQTGQALEGEAGSGAQDARSPGSSNPQPATTVEETKPSDRK